MLAVTLALARVLVEPGASPPSVTDDAVLVMRTDVPCPSAPPADAGAVVDAGAPPDAGPGCTPSSQITLVVQPRFTIGPSGSRFALLYVTPFDPTVNTEWAGTFDELAALSAPVIHVHEVDVPDSTLGTQCTRYYGGGGGGCAGGGTSNPPPDASWHPPAVVDAAPGDGPTAQIGPYEVAFARPVDSTALAAWLQQLGYAYTQADVDAVTPYLARNYVVVAVRVSVDGPLDGALVPLGLRWSGSDLRLPVALGERPALEPLTAYVAAPTRYQFPDATLHYAYPTDQGFYLTRSEIEIAPSGSPDLDPVALSADGPDYQDVIDQNQEVHVPVEDCSSHSPPPEPIGCCPACNTQRTRFPLDFVAVVAAFAWVTSRGRRRRRSSGR
jgi:hypothetical protein